MKTIVLVFPYFGKFPSLFKVWWQSALLNPTVDFLIFTDDHSVISQDNIKVIYMNFDEFASLTQRCFNFKIVLDRPYKLCDYKHTYGYVLKDYIGSYDFWGFGDVDLVYGDIRSFFTEEILSRYKFFLGWGHLSLFKNDEDVNTYFMKHEEGYQYYEQSFTTPKITFFDEYGYNGCADKWKGCRPNDSWLASPFDNASKPKQSYHFNSLSREWERVVFEHLGNKLFMIRIKNGNLERRESLYAHFQHRPFMKDKVSDYSHFLITPSSLINYPKRFEKLKIKWYTRNQDYMTKYYQWKDRILWKLKNL